MLADQQPQLGALTSWASWLSWRDTVIARYREQGQQCPLNALITQMGRATMPLEAALDLAIGYLQASKG